MGRHNDRDPLGRREPVVDAAARVRGRISYVSDMYLPGMLHARILRSTTAHGRIVDVDLSAAARLPGVIAAVSGMHVPGTHDAPRLFGIVVRDTPILAVDRVRYVGEPVAAVAAVDPDTADDAIARIVVKYQDVQAIHSIRESLADGAPEIHGGGNVVGERTLSTGDVEAAMASAPFVVSETFYVPPVQGVPLETHAVVALATDDSITVHTATQTPHHVRRELSALFDLPLEQVRVIVPAVGGGFGAKAYPRIEPLAVLLARQSGRPVKLVLSRAEEFITVQRQPADIELETAVDHDGRLLAMRAGCTFGAGAYVDNVPRILRHALYSLSGPYRIPAVALTSRAAYTNTPPCGPLRAPGTAQVQWAREAHLDSVAMKIGMDPFELRRLNFVDSSDRFALGGPMGPVHLPELLEAVKQPNAQAPGAGRRRQGVGYGIAMKTTSTPSTSEAQATMDHRGALHISTSTVEIGQGSRTALSQIAASALSVPVGHVVVSGVDTAVTPADDGTVSSRSTFSMGGAVARAVLNLRDQLLALAERQLEIDRSDLVVASGRVRPVDGSMDGIELGEIIRASGLETIEASGVFTNEPMHDPGSGETGVSTHHHQAAASARIEVDLETGAVVVLEIRVATHAGLVVNPTLAELQSEGNVTFGVGQALMEEIIFDAGQMQNASLADYLVPSMRDLPPRIDSRLGEDHLREIHGIGETALPAVLPAITNAICVAIDARLREIPATPERVLRARGTGPKG